MKSKRVLVALLTVTMAVTTLLTGCKDSKDPAANAYKGDVIVDTTIGDEPETLDCQQLSGAPDMYVANMFIEGLTRFGKEEGKYVPGVAKNWTFDQPSNTYTFNLRNDSKWSNGETCTAKDFVFGWRLALDQNTVYSFMLLNIAGTQDYADATKEAFLAGKDAAFKALVDSRDAEKDKTKKKDLNKQISDKIAAMTDAQNTEFKKLKDDLWAKVGVKVDGEYKLSVTLGFPCPYFIGLTAFPVYYPVNEKFYNDHPKDYTTEAVGLNCNGPWIVKEWKHKDSFALEKSKTYWNKANIKIDKINIKVVNDVATRTNLLKAGDIDNAGIQGADLKTFQDKAVLDQYYLQDLKDMPDYTVFYLEFNHFSNPITQNVNIRKAISLAIDRKGITEKISVGDMPALSMIPDYFPGLKKAFRDENGKTLMEDNQVSKAKELLATGLKELNMAQLPAMDMLCDTGDVSKREAEKIQNDLKQVGINVNILPMPWGEKLQRLKNGNFGICCSGWGPDYMDPMTYLDLFQSTNGNNHGKYNNAKYDELINAAVKETDPAKRMDSLYKAEKILMEDMVIAPRTFRVAHFAYKTYFTGVVNRGAGPSPDFYYANVDMVKKNELKKK